MPKSYIYDESLLRPSWKSEYLLFIQKRNYFQTFNRFLCLVFEIFNTKIYYFLKFELWHVIFGNIALRGKQKVGANFDSSLFWINLAWFWLLLLILPAPQRLLDVFWAFFVWSIYFYVLTVPKYFTPNNKNKHKLARTSMSLRMTSCDVARFLRQLRGMIVSVWPRVRSYTRQARIVSQIKPALCHSTYTDSKLSTPKVREVVPSDLFLGPSSWTLHISLSLCNGKSRAVLSCGEQVTLWLTEAPGCLRLLTDFIEHLISNFYQMVWKFPDLTTKLHH